MLSFKMDCYLVFDQIWNIEWKWMRGVYELCHFGRQLFMYTFASGLPAYRSDHRMCRSKGKNHVVTKFFTPLRLSLRAMSQFLTDEFYSIPSYIIMISIRIMIAFTDGHRES